MKKIIKGRVYNTDTAEKIMSIPHLCLSLYRKNSSIEFFTVSNNGQQWQPLKWKDARELVYKYGTREQFCKYFTLYDAYGNLKKQRTNLDMDKESYTMLRILAGEHDSSVKGYMRRMIHDRYKAYERKRKKETALQSNSPVPVSQLYPIRY